MKKKGYINGYCTCCRGITVHSFHDPEQKVRCIICKRYCGKSGKCGKRTGICPAEAENEKRNKTGEASCCILPKPDESVLCYAASGD